MKFKNFKILFEIILVILMVNTVSATVGDNVGEIVKGGNLIITDVDVKVGSKSDKNLVDGDDISDEGAPGDTVQFSIEVANNYTRDDDIKIEDITIKVTIEGIDDDDDLEEESREFDIKADRDERKRLTFEIPLIVDEDTFDVIIEVEGGTKKNGSHEVRMELTLEVEKEDHEVIFLRNSITPSEIKCSRSVQLLTSLINTGSNNEDDVVLEISNSELGVSFREVFDLSDDPFDDDSKFKKTFTFTIENEISPGVYPILSRVIFDDGSETTTETADLIVGTCKTLIDEKEEEKEKEEEQKKEEEVIVVQPPITDPIVTTGQAVADIVSAPTLPIVEEKSFFQTSAFLITLIAGEILLVIIAILIVIAVVRRKNV